jgi:hypothetical protein
MTIRFEKLDTLVFPEISDCVLDRSSSKCAGKLWHGSLVILSEGLLCSRINRKVCQHILVTPLGNQFSPIMAHYGLEIYNNNIIMPSIYTNPEIRYMNYLSVDNYFDPSCVNYFGRVQQENFPLDLSVTFSQPMTMQQVMLMNDLYG